MKKYLIKGELTKNYIMRGGRIVEAIGIGIILVIVLIAFLEICRFFRQIINLSREIDDIKRRLSNIEEFIENQNK